MQNMPKNNQQGGFIQLIILIIILLLLFRYFDLTNSGLREFYAEFWPALVSLLKSWFLIATEWLSGFFLWLGGLFRGIRNMF